jgi:hypothetical protein
MTKSIILATMAFLLLDANGMNQRQWERQRQGKQQRLEQQRYAQQRASNEAKNQANQRNPKGKVKPIQFKSSRR